MDFDSWCIAAYSIYCHVRNICYGLVLIGGVTMKKRIAVILLAAVLVVAVPFSTFAALSSWESLSYSFLDTHAW